MALLELNLAAKENSLKARANKPPKVQYAPFTVEVAHLIIHGDVSKEALYEWLAQQAEDINLWSVYKAFSGQWCASKVKTYD